MAKVTQPLETSKSDLLDMLAEQTAIANQAMATLGTIQSIAQGRVLVKQPLNEILSQIEGFLDFRQRLTLDDELEALTDKTKAA